MNIFLTSAMIWFAFWAAINTFLGRRGATVWCLCMVFVAAVWLLIKNLS